MRDDIPNKRRAIEHLLQGSDPSDALTSYYALWHEPRRTSIALHRGSDGQVDGFVAVSQTGADLFRPLVTLRAPSEGVAAELLRTALNPNRPYRFAVPASLAAAIRQSITSEEAQYLNIYLLDTARYQPIVNVLVQRSTDAAGADRFRIESQGKVVALAGTNWRSPGFAEIFVQVDPSGRQRGWGKSVASACTAAALADRLHPLYMVEQDNIDSQRLAASLGYVDTGLQEFSAVGRLIQNGPPAAVAEESSPG